MSQNFALICAIPAFRWDFCFAEALADKVGGQAVLDHG
jgi:hypothetical protein